MMQNFLAFRDSPIIPLRRSPVTRSLFCTYVVCTAGFRCYSHLSSNFSFGLGDPDSGAKQSDCKRRKWSEMVWSSSNCCQNSNETTEEVDGTVIRNNVALDTLLEYLLSVERLWHPRTGFLILNHLNGHFNEFGFIAPRARCHFMAGLRLQDNFMMQLHKGRRIQWGTRIFVHTNHS